MSNPANPRERILFFITLGVVALGMGYMVYFKAIIQPTRADRANIQNVTSDIEDQELELARGKHFKSRLDQWYGASFGSDRDEASEHMRAHLIRLHNLAKLNPAERTLTPITGRILRKGAGQEIGWSLRTRGDMNRIIDLLFLLQNDTRLHKLENISWMPIAQSNEVELSLRYITLVPQTPPGEEPIHFVADEPGEKIDPKVLQQRKQYTVIAQRDLFRPYIKRPPPPPQENKPPSKPVDQLALQKVVGLPMWAGVPTVTILNTETQVRRTYRIGSKLLGGEVVYIDYRPLPRQDKPHLNSSSRVFVRIGPELWSIELGQTLAQRRRLPDTLIPKALKDDANPPSNQDSTSQTSKEVHDET